MGALGTLYGSAVSLLCFAVALLGCSLSIRVAIQAHHTYIGGHGQHGQRVLEASGTKARGLGPWVLSVKL